MLYHFNVSLFAFTAGHPNKNAVLLQCENPLCNEHNARANRVKRQPYLASGASLFSGAFFFSPVSAVRAVAASLSDK